MSQTALTLPVSVDRIIDGDTVEVTLQITAHVRLLDCWAPEKNTEEGQLAAENLTRLGFGKQGHLSIPYTSGKGLGKILSFGRLLGKVVVDGKDLSIAQVADGFATEEKQQ